MKFRLFFVAIMAFASLQTYASQPHSTSYGVGERDYVFHDAARKRHLKTRVWYPIEASTRMTPVRQRGPFLPVVASINAPLAKASQRYPVVLLSHGSGGTADRLFWLVDTLVRDGIVVIAVNHPGNMTGDNSGAGVVNTWDRPKDLSFVFDRALEMPEFKEHLDTARVAAAGHSAGGTTALLLSGARISYDRYSNPTPNCEGSDDPYYAKLCTEIKALNLRSFPKSQVEGDYRDPRVKAAVGIDPGFAKSFDPESLKKIAPRSFIFIADKLRESQDEIFSKDFLRLLSKDNVAVVPNSVHMSFLSPCKPGVLPEGELKSLCADNDRKQIIQKEVARKTLVFFQKIWSNP